MSVCHGRKPRNFQPAILPSSPPLSLLLDLAQLIYDKPPHDPHFTRALWFRKYLGLVVRKTIAALRRYSSWPDEGSLQDQALLLLLLPCEQCSTRGMLKHLTNSFIGLGRAFEIFLGADLLADILSL